MTREVAQWMIRHSYATGHGDTLDDLLGELVHQVHANALLEAHKAAATTGLPTDDARKLRTALLALLEFIDHAKNYELEQAHAYKVYQDARKALADTESQS